MDTGNNHVQWEFTDANKVAYANGTLLALLPLPMMKQFSSHLQALLVLLFPGLEFNRTKAGLVYRNAKKKAIPPGSLQQHSQSLLKVGMYGPLLGIYTRIIRAPHDYRVSLQHQRVSL